MDVKNEFIRWIQPAYSQITSTVVNGISNTIETILTTLLDASHDPGDLRRQPQINYKLFDSSFQYDTQKHHITPGIAVMTVNGKRRLVVSANPIPLENFEEYDPQQMIISLYAEEVQVKQTPLYKKNATGELIQEVAALGTNIVLKARAETDNDGIPNSIVVGRDYLSSYNPTLRNLNIVDRLKIGGSSLDGHTLYDMLNTYQILKNRSGEGRLVYISLSKESYTIKDAFTKEIINEERWKRSYNSSFGDMGPIRRGLEVPNGKIVYLKVCNQYLSSDYIIQAFYVSFPERRYFSYWDGEGTLPESEGWVLEDYSLLTSPKKEEEGDKSREDLVDLDSNKYDWWGWEGEDLLCFMYVKYNN